MNTAVCGLEVGRLSYKQRVQESLGQWQTRSVIQTAACNLVSFCVAACPVIQRPLCCMQAVKEALDIPVLANGNIRHLQVRCSPPS